MKPTPALLRILIAASILITFTSTTSAGPRGPEKTTEHSNKPFDREASLQQREQAHRWLLSEKVSKGLGSPIVAAFSDEEKASVDRISPDDAPMRVGLVRSLSVDVSFDDLKMSQVRKGILTRPHGALSPTADGGYVYSAMISSPGATGVRVHFKGFNLPESTSLYLYNEAGQVFGPYTGKGPQGDGEFWSHTVIGEYVLVQLRSVGEITNDDLRKTAFRVAGVAHIRPGFLSGFCSYNHDCVENASCVGSSPADPARMAVALMQWTSGAWVYICSGGLLADTDESSVIPYFLTANHCISRSRDARNMEAFFQLIAACGQTNCDELFSNHPQELRTLGATIKDTHKLTDHTLMTLNQPAPDGSSYLGWNATPIAFTDGTQLFRISHPSGAPQAYSEHEVDIIRTACGGWPRGNYIYSRDLHGTTEGGSSGSPLLNLSGQVVGQLTGGCGSGGENFCDYESYSTVDGAFANYFEDVREFLDPEGGSCTPVPEVCDDNVDNDCDGFIDILDSDCDGGGDGYPKGHECEADSDCASNKCRGKSGQKTCK